ncbi:peptidoglycan-binding domain-containing protein [Luteipulveratus halotolerans]|uniref:Peptidoglycan binding-like domain-containing protein n=1 Tax=Luteipulveratus halotolerans TaxID=1631356 RepID=A0A0L6CGA2_9MICO|nr:peptidoglycan-binding domain-containing protein [Luteipulveratus halotolerans]KNX36832.1 hypothetical protein VV01_06190 [Luteipulveratus halotolerans]
MPKRSIMLRTVGAAVAMTALATVATAVSPAPASAATNSCRYTYVNRYDTGYCVRMAQTLLKGPFTVNTGGFTANLAIDGSFGPATEAATVKYQRSQGILVDGSVGPQTWGRLCSFGVGGGAQNTTPETIKRFNAAFDATC